MFIFIGSVCPVGDYRLSRCPEATLAQLIHGTRTRGGQRKRFKDTAKHERNAKLTSMPGNLWLRTVRFGAVAYTRQRQHLIQTVYFTRRKNGREEKRGRCLNIFTSPFYQALPFHTATRSADQESGSRVTSGHMTDHWQTSSSFRGTADDHHLSSRYLKFDGSSRAAGTKGN